MRKIWKTGDEVRITFAGQTIDGRVLLTSENGRSLVVTFDGLLGGYAGAMPIQAQEDGCFVDLISRYLVLLRPREAPL